MFLFLGRLLPIITLVPFFGGKVMPRPAKMALALSLFIAFFPQLIFMTKTPLAFNFTLLIFFLKELLIGVLMGFFLAIPFNIVQSTGTIIDNQRGASSLMVNDPTVQSQTSPLGTLFNLLLIVLFFTLDGPFKVLDILERSYELLPPDQLISDHFFSSHGVILPKIMGIMGHIMILSTQLAAPALIIVLMTDFFLGIANRLAPQVQITFLGMPLKSLLALTVLFLGWQLFNQEMISQAMQALHQVTILMQQIAGPSP